MYEVLKRLHKLDRIQKRKQRKIVSRELKKNLILELPWDYLEKGEWIRR